MLGRCRRKRQKQRNIKIDEKLEERVNKRTEHIANACVDNGDLNLEDALLVEAVGLDAFVML